MATVAARLAAISAQRGLGFSEKTSSRRAGAGGMIPSARSSPSSKTKTLSSKPTSPQALRPPGCDRTRVSKVPTKVMKTMSDDSNIGKAGTRTLVALALTGGCPPLSRMRSQVPVSGVGGAGCGCCRWPAEIAQKNRMDRSTGRSPLADLPRAGGQRSK